MRNFERNSIETRELTALENVKALKRESDNHQRRLIDFALDTIPLKKQRFFHLIKREAHSDIVAKYFQYPTIFVMDDSLTTNEVINKTYLYKSLSPRQAQVLWVIAVCQNCGISASREVIATALSINRNNVANILHQIQRLSQDYVKAIPLVNKAQFVQSLSSREGQSAEFRERMRYLIPVEKTISKPETAQIVLEVQKLFNEGSFLKMAQLKKHLNKSFGFSSSYIMNRLEMGINNNYLTIKTSGEIMPSDSDRLVAEQNFLSLLVENQQPAFLANLVGLQEIEK